jgi:hypothetical protein
VIDYVGVGALNVGLFGTWNDSDSDSEYDSAEDHDSSSLNATNRNSRSTNGRKVVKKPSLIGGATLSLNRAVQSEGTEFSITLKDHTGTPVGSLNITATRCESSCEHAESACVHAGVQQTCSQDSGTDGMCVGDKSVYMYSDGTMRGSDMHSNAVHADKSSNNDTHSVPQQRDNVNDHKNNIINIDHNAHNSNSDRHELHSNISPLPHTSNASVAPNLASNQQLRDAVYALFDQTIRVRARAQETVRTMDAALSREKRAHARQLETKRLFVKALEHELVVQKEVQELACVLARDVRGCVDILGCVLKEHVRHGEDGQTPGRGGRDGAYASNRIDVTGTANVTFRDIDACNGRADVSNNGNRVDVAATADAGACNGHVIRDTDTRDGGVGGLRSECGLSAGELTCVLYGVEEAMISVKMVEEQVCACVFVCVYVCVCVLMRVVWS